MAEKIETIYNIKFVSSGKRLEIYKYKGYIRKGNTSKNKEGRRGKKGLSEVEKEYNTLVSRKANINKIKNEIVRIVECNQDLKTFITLTYAENMKDVKKSKKEVNELFKKLRSEQENLKYIYVLEFQNRGAIHYHILTNFKVNHSTGRYNVTQEQNDFNIYFKDRYWLKGFVDVRNLEAEGNTNIAKYMSAYMTLDLYKHDLNGARVWSCSRNIERPVITTAEIKAPVDSIEGYQLSFSNEYDIVYKDKSGSKRINKVNYYDYYIKGEKEE